MTYYRANKPKYSTSILLLLLIQIQVTAKPVNYGSVTISEVTSIYDGDTFRANISEWHGLIGKDVSIRVNGIDTPELRGKCKQEKLLASKAKQHAVAMLREGNIITLNNMKRGKYFRIVADINIDGKSLAKSLIKANLAVPYEGSTKTKDWCG